MRLQSACALAFALCIGAASSAYGAIISGELNIGGSARVSSTEIDFLPMDGGDGDFMVDPFAPGTGSFAGFGGDEGLIKDLDLALQPVDAVFSLEDFMTFLNGSGITFELTFIHPGVSGAAGCANVNPGATCTPPGSPFNLRNLRNGWDASFEVEGFVTDGSGDPASRFEGIFTTQEVSGATFQEALAAINAGGFVEATYSAQFTVTPEGLAPIPEPGSMFLFGAGLLGLGYIKRRRAN